MNQRTFVVATICCAALLCARNAQAQPEGQPCEAETTDQLMAYGDHIHPCEIGLLGDSDLFRFQGTAGEVVSMRVVDQAGLSSVPSCVLELFRPTATLVTSVNDVGTCEIQTTLDATGLFTARVTEFANNHLMTYSVQLDRLAPTSPVATTINPGDTIANAEIDPTGDADLFIFNGVSGDVISLRATDQAGLFSVPSCVLDLYNPNGTLVTAVHDVGTCVIDTTLNASGVFTARVTEFGNNHLMTFNLEYQCLIGSCLSFPTLTPTSFGDAFGTPPDTPLVIAAPGVLANDNSNGGGAMTAALATGVSHGALALSANGGFSYTPSAGFTGVDSFVYRASNTNGAGNTATVTLTVTTVPPPTAVNDAFNLAANGSLNIAAPGVLGNDNSNGGGAMTASLFSSTSSGTLALGTNGGFSYIPAFNFVGTDSFTYRAVSAVGISNIATVAINVLNPTNPQPPTNVLVDSVVGNVVTVRFTAPVLGPTPTGYTLKGGVLPGQVLAAIPTGHAAPIFTFLVPTGSFFIRMHAVAAAGESSASNEVPLHVNVPVVPSAPVGLLGLVNGSSLALAWKNTFGGGPPSDIILDVTGSLSASLTLGVADSFNFSLVPGGMYTLTLRAVNAGGISASSNSVTLAFPGACSGAPLVPSNFLADKIGNTIVVIWDPAASGPAPTQYVLDVTGSFVGTLPTTGRTISGAVGPGSYSLSVRATNPCGSSPATPVQFVSIP